MAKYNLAGRTVAVTGSTGGLGSGLVTASRARGANLALFDLDQDAVERQAAALGSETMARGRAADVRDLTALTEVMNAAAEHFGRIDVVIANAGIAPPAVPLGDLEGKDFERAIDINAPGPSPARERSQTPDLTDTTGGGHHPHGQIRVRHWAVLNGHLRAVLTSAHGQFQLSIDTGVQPS